MLARGCLLSCTWPSPPESEDASRDPQDSIPRIPVPTEDCELTPRDEAGSDSSSLSWRESNGKAAAAAATGPSWLAIGSPRPNRSDWAMPMKCSSRERSSRTSDNCTIDLLCARLRVHRAACKCPLFLRTKCLDMHGLHLPEACRLWP